MSDTSKPVADSEQEPTTAADLPDAESASGEVAVQASQGELQKAEGTGEILPAGQAERELENLQLLARFFLGVLLMGSGGFIRIVRQVQQELEAEPDPSAQDSDKDDDTLRDLLRYLSIGLLAQGTEGVVGLVGGGYRLSLDVARRLIGGVDRVTDNRLARPLRRAMISGLEHLEREADLVIEKGRVEEQGAKRLSSEAMDQLIDQAIDAVAESPELTDMIISIVSQQGKGMAGVAGDNARSLSVVADNATERLVRRLFRRKPRQELSPSPMRGKSQSGYSAEELVRGMIEHEQ